MTARLAHRPGYVGEHEILAAPVFRLKGKALLRDPYRCADTF